MDFDLSLEKIGLSRQEARVYVSALKLGVAKASGIAKDAGITRESSYYILKLLQEKGFISEVIKGGVKHYSAIQPKRILDVIEEDRQKKEDAIKGILPALESLQKIALTKPAIEVYEGVGGFKTILGKLVERENQTIHSYVPESILHFLPAFHSQYRRRRKERNVRTNIITKRTSFMEKIKEKDKEELRETRFNDRIMHGIDAAFFILPDEIIMVKANEREQVGVSVKEPGLARLHQNIFDEMWRVSE